MNGCLRPSRLACDPVFVIVKHLTRARLALRYCLLQLQQRAVKDPREIPRETPRPIMTGMMTEMTTRRMITWWFWVVVSGRFLDRFLCLPRAPRG
jgi:hypothetical protein